MIDEKSNAVRSKTGDPDPGEYFNTSKDPFDWVTGNEPMNGAQASCLRTLCEETGVDVDGSLSKAPASERTDRLRAESPFLKGAGADI